MHNQSEETNRYGGDFIKHNRAGISLPEDFFTNSAEPDRECQAEDGSAEKHPEIARKQKQGEPAHPDDRTERSRCEGNSSNAEALSEPEKEIVHMSSRYNVRFRQR